MPTATVTTKGQITIPKAVRDHLRVDAGDQVDFTLNERGEVIVRGVTTDIKSIRGLLKRPRKQAVTIEEMDAAILRAHARKR